MCSSDQLPAMSHPSLIDSHSAFSPMSAAAATVCTAAAAMTSFHHQQHQQQQHQQHQQAPRFLTAPIHHYLQPQLHHLTAVHPHVVTYHQSHHLNTSATSPRSPSPGSDKTSYSDWTRDVNWLDYPQQYCNILYIHYTHIKIIITLMLFGMGTH